MKGTSHIGFWMVAFFVAIFVTPIFVSADLVYARLVEEFLSVQSVFGSSVGSAIVCTTNWIHGLLVHAGLQDALTRGVHDGREMREAETYLSAIGRLGAETGSRYLVTLLMELYSVTMRLVIVGFWSLLLLPFLGAAVVDGLSWRKVKFATFGYQNPTAFSLGSHALILIAVLPLLYVVMPFAVSPMFMPIWALVAAFPMCFAISHAQPIFTR